GPFAANVLMGVIFAVFYLTWGRRRVMPLVITHTLLDVGAFVGYEFLPQEWLSALGVSVSGGSAPEGPRVAGSTRHGRKSLPGAAASRDRGGSTRRGRRSAP